MRAISILTKAAFPASRLWGAFGWLLLVLISTSCQFHRSGAAIDWSAAKTGSRITEVRPNSPAARLGLQPGDVVIGFNGIPVSDFDQLSEIQQAALRDRSRNSVELVLFRNQVQSPVFMKAPNTLLGFMSTDWTLDYAFVYDALINHEDQERAEKLTAAADASHAYNNRQILHMKVLVIPNGATAQDEARRRQMTDSLIQQYGIKNVAVMAAWELMNQKRYRAAIPIFERAVADDESDSDNILNLASTEAHIGLYQPAEELLRRPQAAPDRLTDYGQHVRYGIETNILLGRRQLDLAIPRLQEEAIEGGLYSNFEYLFAVAETGDMDRFRAAKAELQKRDPFLLKAAPYHVDLLEAHAWRLSGRNEEASALLAKWRDDPDAKLFIPKFWPGVPNGQDVIDTWNSIHQELTGALAE